MYCHPVVHRGDSRTLGGANRAHGYGADTVDVHCDPPGERVQNHDARPHAKHLQRDIRSYALGLAWQPHGARGDSARSRPTRQISAHAARSGSPQTISVNAEIVVAEPRRRTHCELTAIQAQQELDVVGKAQPPRRGGNVAVVRALLNSPRPRKRRQICFQVSPRDFGLGANTQMRDTTRRSRIIAAYTVRSRCAGLQFSSITPVGPPVSDAHLAKNAKATKHRARAVDVARMETRFSYSSARHAGTNLIASPAIRPTGCAG
jgi:hypothetical protein